MTFSIVIPIYFYNDFVMGMFRSIQDQDFNDYEIIIVGNGISEKEFFIIKDEIKALFNETGILVNYIYTDKKGANNARMIGYQNAVGEYIFFMDSDDQLTSSDIFSKANTVIKQAVPDILSVNLQHALLKDDTLYPKNIIYNYIRPDEILDIEKDMSIIVKNYGTNICARFIKRELLKEIHFLDLPYCQDWNVSSKLFLKAKTFYFLSEPSYYWIYREDSISRIDSMSLEKHLKSFDSILDILQFYKANPIHKKNTYFIYDRIVKFCFQYVGRSSFFDIKEGFKRSDKLLKDEIKFNSSFLMNKRIVQMYLMLKIRPLYKLYLKSIPEQK